MKYINHVKSSLLAIAFVCAGMCFTGCEDDVVINTGDLGKLETVDGMYGYVKSAAGARELTPISVFGDNVATGHLYFELSKVAEQDVTVTFKVDEDALNAYNTAHGTAYKMYPADKLNLANGGTTTIKAGEQKSASVELNINAGGSIGETYAVAISASADNSVEVSTNNQTYIYLVKPLAAVPENIRKGDVTTMCFVEVNNENILNCGEYTMKSSGKPFFDIVSIFAANINVDSKTGRVHIFCNDQVSFLLQNADKFIRPLQAKGIKVNLSILGNHDEAGMGSLSPEAAADFAKELKVYMDIYGLDGVDFDDEYTSYKNDPSPGFLPRSRENYARLVYEVRRVLGPDKLIGIYEYSSMDSPTGTVEGKTVGEIVDYITHGLYQQQRPGPAIGRETHFTGLQKSQFGPNPWKVNGQDWDANFDGGWYNFAEEKFRQVKDEGYGLQMIYNPKFLEYDYAPLFSAISSILYEDGVEWTGKCYGRTDEAPVQGMTVGYESYLGTWEATTSSSLFPQYDSEGNFQWWQWGSEQNFTIRVEEKEAGKSYYVYGWGNYPEITDKYPLVVDYDVYDGSISISVPQVIHKGDAEDGNTWEMRWGTFGKGPKDWNFYDYDNSLSGIANPQGTMKIQGIARSYAIDPCHEVDGKLVPPHMNVDYHGTDNYTLVKKD